MSIKIPANSAGHLFSILLAYLPQITVDIADAAVAVKCPVRATVVGVQGILRATGGTPHTAIAVEVLKNTTALLTVNLPLVASSVFVTGGTFGTLSTVSGALDVAADDVLAIKNVDITGGSTPTADGLQIIVWLLTK